MEPRNTRVLIAEVASVAPRLQSILGEYECTSVRTLAEARCALDGEPFNLVVICVQFNESRMFELLEHIVNDERLADTPVVCLRDEEGPAAKPAGIALSVTALGARLFLDLRKLPDTETGNARLTQLFSHLLLLEADMNAYRAGSGKSTISASRM
jgi:CheY-like chemotaxis protein